MVYAGMPQAGFGEAWVPVFEKEPGPDEPVDVRNVVLLLVSLNSNPRLRK